jgi:hypothetical protein
MERNILHLYCSIYVSVSTRNLLHIYYSIHVSISTRNLPHIYYSIYVSLYYPKSAAYIFTKDTAHTCIYNLEEMRLYLWVALGNRLHNVHMDDIFNGGFQRMLSTDVFNGSSVSGMRE